LIFALRISKLQGVFPPVCKEHGTSPAADYSPPAPARHAGRAAPCQLLIAPTGGGKTLAGFLPTLAELADGTHEGLHTLYVSPLKALAADIKRNLTHAVEEMGLPIRVEDRTGDTPSTQEAPARRPAAYPADHARKPRAADLLRGRAAHLRGLKRVIVDEIHALAESKRGDQLMLALSRPVALAPGLRRVGLSATVEDPAGHRPLAGPPPRPLRDPAGRSRPRPRHRHAGPPTTPPPWSGGGGATRSPRCWRR
jgi:ATP-dependent Lhr-like helicase